MQRRGRDGTSLDIFVSVESLPQERGDSHVWSCWQNRKRNHQTNAVWEAGLVRPRLLIEDWSATIRIINNPANILSQLLIIFGVSNFGRTRGTQNMSPQEPGHFETCKILDVVCQYFPSQFVDISHRFSTPLKSHRIHLRFWQKGYFASPTLNTLDFLTFYRQIKGKEAQTHFHNTKLHHV